MRCFLAWKVSSPKYLHLLLFFDFRKGSQGVQKCCLLKYGWNAPKDLDRITLLRQVQNLVCNDDIKPFYVSREKKGDKRPIFPHQKTHIKILPDIFLRWPREVFVCAFDFPPIRQAIVTIKQVVGLQRA